MASDIDGSSGEVIRIDPATNQVVARIPVEGRLRDIYVSEHSVWALAHGEALIRIDPQSNTVVDRLDRVMEAAVGPGALWISDWLINYLPEEPGAEHHVAAVRLDPQTLEMQSAFRRDHFRPIAVTETGVWYIGGPSPPQGICHLDPSTGDVGACVDYGTLADPLPWPVAFDPITGTIWVANQRDTVTRIDIG